MKTRTKVALTVLCALLLVTVSILGTLAYLTSETETVTNTFTVGNVTITLDEAKVDEYGVIKEGEDRVTANTYKLIPGHTYVKDPTIHVAQGSEKCYVFVKVENGISGIEATSTIAEQLAKDSTWVKIEENSGVYYYKDTVDARNKAVDVKTFESFTIKGDADFTNVKVDGTEGATAIKVTAYAVQADGFEDAPVAWKATFGKADA